MCSWNPPFPYVVLFSGLSVVEFGWEPSNNHNTKENSMVSLDVAHVLHKTSWALTVKFSRDYWTPKC
jgi:hypothetical protein